MLPASVRFAFMTVAVACLLTACGGALASRDVRFFVADTPVLVRDSGAIIVDKRQVGKLADGGKVLDNRGRVLAWVFADSIRLRGGVSLAVKEDAEGGVYLPEAQQARAGLKPVAYRIRPNGTMARTRGAEGVPITGFLSPERRRLILFILLATANDLWS